MRMFHQGISSEEERDGDGGQTKAGLRGLWCQQRHIAELSQRTAVWICWQRAGESLRLWEAPGICLLSFMFATPCLPAAFKFTAQAIAGVFFGHKVSFRHEPGQAAILYCVPGIFALAKDCPGDAIEQVAAAAYVAVGLQIGSLSCG